MARPGSDTQGASSTVSFSHCSGYAYDDPWIAGCSHLRPNGMGVPDDGVVAVIPTVGWTDEERTSVGYYSVPIGVGQVGLKDAILVELTAGLRAVLHRITTPTSASDEAGDAELGWRVFLRVYMTVLAYIASLVVYQGGAKRWDLAEEGWVSEALYERYRRALRDEPRPVAFVDLDGLEANTDKLLRPLRAAGKRLRIASKSLRCRDLLLRIAQRAGDSDGGVMAYAATEAEWLVQHGVSDVLLAYPTGQRSDAQAIARANAGDATVSVVVDCLQHLDLLDGAGRDVGSTIPVVVEIDVSYRPLGGAVHLGGRRSPLHDARSVVDLAMEAEARSHLCFGGVMGYESHIAGVQDDNPFTPWLNRPKQWLKALDKRRVASLRAETAELLESHGLGGRLFNGGGTGSVAWTSEEPDITEVSAGSGFVNAALFDYYAHLRQAPLVPAIGFSLQVVRIPGPGLATLHGGGFIASGEAGPDKLPVPWLPEGLGLLDMEGAGEVQTPVSLPRGMELSLGDPVFLRHAKAGELAEHVREYVLLRGDAIVGRAPTYRGEGKCFLG